MKQLLLTGLAALMFTSLGSAANKFVQHNLVSDLIGVADHVDPCLINPWGITASPTSPFWVSANGSGLSTVYDGNGNAANLIVQISATLGTQGSGSQCGKAATGTGSPTGIVFNDTASFLLGTAPASFIFATEQGFIHGLNTILLLGALLSFAGAVFALWLVRENEIERETLVGTDFEAVAEPEPAQV